MSKNIILCHRVFIDVFIKTTNHCFIHNVINLDIKMSHIFTHQERFLHDVSNFFMSSCRTFLYIKKGEILSWSANTAVRQESEIKIYRTQIRK